MKESRVALVISVLAAIAAGVASYGSIKQADATSDAAASAAKQAAAAAEQATAAVNLWKADLTKAVNEDEKVERQRQDDAKRNWQELVVYSIIDKGFTNNGFVSGVSFDEIKNKYIEAAQIVDSVRLEKKDIQPDILGRILLDLLKSNVVYRTHDDKYVSQRTAISPRFSRLIPEEESEQSVLSFVSVAPGTHSVPEASQTIQDKHKLSAEEATTVIIGLLAANKIRIDEKGKLWSATSPPPSGPTIGIK